MVGRCILSDMNTSLTDVDRVAIRHRPDGQPIMHQKWGKLLFMHWRIDARVLRPLIPVGLEVGHQGVSAFCSAGARIQFVA